VERVRPARYGASGDYSHVRRYDAHSGRPIALPRLVPPQLQPTYNQRSHPRPLVSNKITVNTCTSGFKKPGFLKSNPLGFLGVLGFYWVLLGFLDKQEKIGKIIQKLSNLKP